MEYHGDHYTTPTSPERFGACMKELWCAQGFVWSQTIAIVRSITDSETSKPLPKRMNWCSLSSHQKFRGKTKNFREVAHPESAGKSRSARTQPSTSRKVPPICFGLGPDKVTYILMYSTCFRKGFNLQVACNKSAELCCALLTDNQN